MSTKTVILWAAPRCVSTAFEKTFSCRSDTEVVHEPFCDVYFFSQWRRSERFGDCEDLWDYSGKKAVEQINAPRTPLVFVKDHAYQALPYIDHTFLESKINTFIIRDPQEVLLSWYKVGELPTLDEFGFIALEKIWTIVTQDLELPAIVVDATQFRKEPEQTLRKYCQDIQVEFNPQMLAWETGKLKNWNTREAEFHRKWHSTLDSSTKILPLDTIEVNRQQMKIYPEHLDMLSQAQDIYKMLVP